MAIELTAEEGSTLYLAAALRGASEAARSTKDGLETAQESADVYSCVLNEMAYILLVALGKVKEGEDGEGDPLALAREAATTIVGLRRSVNYYSGGTTGE